MKVIKNPKDCNNISEIRDALDHIDQELIQLFSRRQAYVKEIVKFKSGDESIVASERRAQVLKQRKAWAEEKGLDPELLEEIFKLLIERNIQMQFEIYKMKHPCLRIIDFKG